MRVIEKLSETKDKFLDPRELSYKLGPILRKRILRVQGKRALDKELQQELSLIMDREEETKQLLDYDTLSDIHRILQRLDPEYHLFFYQMLDECRAIAPPGRENKELEARLQRLKYESSVKDYTRMTGSVASSTRAPVTASATEFRNEVQALKPTLTAIINSFLVIVGTFAFIYVVVGYALPEPSIPVQVMASLFGAIIVAIAELYFISKML
jgi:hypothetical protein